MDLNPSIRKMYEPVILEAVHARRFDEALRLVTERNTQIWAQRGNKHHVNFSEWVKIEEIFTKDFIEQKSGLSDCGEGLIFIVGMPRSGKSTLEKLLSGIPNLAAGDELRFMSDQFRKIQDPNGEAWKYPYYAEYLPDPIWQQFGQNYETPTKSVFPDAKYIVDTMPPNFRYLGFIRLILPKAKVICAQRDPIPHMVDMFSKVFESGFYDYTNDWGALTEFYMAYRGLMSHWDHVLGDWLYRVKFEDLIHQPKKTLRGVLEFCDIESEVSIPKLIEPHKDMLTEIEYSIATLKNYRPFLKDLEKQLGVFKRL